MVDSLIARRSNERGNAYYCRMWSGCEVYTVKSMGVVLREDLGYGHNERNRRWIMSDATHGTTHPLLSMTGQRQAFQSKMVS